MNIEDFLKYLKNEKRYSKHTIKSYETDLCQFRDFVLFKEDIDIHELNYENIRHWMVNLKEKGYTSISINRKLSSLKSFVKYFQKQNETFDDPFKKIINPKNNKRLPTFIQERRMNQLESMSIYTEDFSGERDRFIVELFYNTGMRLSELLNLRHKDIDISSGVIKVLGKRNKERIIPLNNYTINIYKVYIEKKKEMKFECGNESYLIVTDKGRKLYEKIIYRKVVYYLGKITGQEKKSPHILRHTFATHMLNNGADLNAIKELLGHTSLSATQVYTHNTFKKLKGIYKQAHPRA